jgi:hypothetical protein
MENIFTKRSWSPFAVGASLGLLMVFTIIALGRWIGASGAFVSVLAFIEHLIVPSYAAVSAYFIEDLGQAPLISFRVLLVVGVVVGAFISARLSGAYTVSRVPEMWANRFGPSFSKRAVVAFLGGIFVMLGAPLSDGCTLSRGIFSGALLDPSAWFFLAATFAAAVGLSFVLYGTKRS